MKFRVIPSILTNGVTVVKGEQFNNWRTIGSAEAVANLYAKRDVDELLLLDVTANLRNKIVSPDLMAHFTRVLDIPFGVGGGIRTLDDAKLCFRLGAEKVVLGSAAMINPQLISEIADVFGSQAVVVALDFKNDLEDIVSFDSGSKNLSVNIPEILKNLEQLGAGEILLQNCERDGKMNGMDLNRIEKVTGLTNLPVVASSGFLGLEDALLAAQAGASAVAIGAAFQFTELTPKIVRKYLKEKGIPVRELN